MSRTATLDTREFDRVYSAAMIYDRQPITDLFRRIDDGIMLGMMALRDDPRTYFFTLTRQQ
ncbi:DUF4334 domain-containing protein [Ensifer sp. HO-A22]|uniref:DUF4334 domain-containing protein n=1 Tax=Ensifer oleiphilus TaxID=2742698 RepID=A0A7Y6QA14_9HYPH|nr:DUF4334 domain-containing protein [Ensifer oleiphilus]